MWDNLTPADIELARQQVQGRYDEILKRQAQEISDLDAEQAAVETLDRLAEAFSRKFIRRLTALPEPTGAAAPPPPYIVEKKEAGEPAPTSHDARERVSHRSRPANHAEHSGTNFDTFSRALSRNL
ncbi:MAG TPA: hypothetical protein VND95_12685 [Stellaceae bacterium]|nr:hypothetical protein [Stellaceae bacterium]